MSTGGLAFIRGGIVTCGVTFYAGNSKYSRAAEAARDKLISVYDWDITDNGLDADYVPSNEPTTTADAITTGLVPTTAL